MVYTLCLFSLQNAVCFIILTYLVPILFTFYIQGVLKLKNYSGAKRLISFAVCPIFGEFFCYSIHGMFTEWVDFSETVISFYQILRRHIQGKVSLIITATTNNNIIFKIFCIEVLGNKSIGF